MADRREEPVGGVVPQRMGSEHPNIVPYGSILACADGREVVIAAATERQYRELVCALGLPELADDPAYATGQLRVRNRDRLLARIRDQAATLASADALWEERIDPDKIGKLARPKHMAFADDLPKTRSGKIMRRLLRDIAAGNELGDVSTLRDPEVVKDLQEQVKE